MSVEQSHPEGKRIGTADPFSFACHPGVSCFTSCCRELELALTPYDLLRLRHGTGLTSSEILAQYVIVEYESDDIFPRLYLSMVDDGRASCVFLGERGCTIYRHRPGACRMYPLGRGVTINKRTGIAEQYILLQESHCRGFYERLINTVSSYLASQELATYNRFADRLAALMQHERIRGGMRPDERQRNLYLRTLCDLDTFRDAVRAGQFGPEASDAVLADDDALLDYAFDIVERALFGNLSSPQG